MNTTNLGTNLRIVGLLAAAAARSSAAIACGGRIAEERTYFLHREAEAALLWEAMARQQLAIKLAARAAAPMRTRRASTPATPVAAVAQ